MENFSVKTLCPNAKVLSKNNKIFGIDNIILPNENTEKEFNVNELIKVRKQKRKKLLETYMKFYNQSLKDIETANSINKTDIFFKIPDSVYDCNEYKSVECIEFIQKKLCEKLIDTLKIDNNTLFISWFYLELNINQHRKRFIS